jgi:hypothetical protein
VEPGDAKWLAATSWRHVIFGEAAGSVDGAEQKQGKRRRQEGKINFQVAVGCARSWLGDTAHAAMRGIYAALGAVISRHAGKFFAHACFFLPRRSWLRAR